MLKSLSVVNPSELAPVSVLDKCSTLWVFMFIRFGGIRARTLNMKMYFKTTWRWFLTLTHLYDAVRGHRTGSNNSSGNNSGVEDYLDVMWRGKSATHEDRRRRKKWWRSCRWCRGTNVSPLIGSKLAKIVSELDKVD